MVPPNPISQYTILMNWARGSILWMTDRFIGPSMALTMNASARIAKFPAIAASNVGKNNSLNFEFNKLNLLSYVI